MAAELGAMLRKKRERLGLNQREVADKIGVSQSALDFWEKGQSIPRFDRAVRWSEVLGYDLWPLEVR
jgi:transcriptional regulator with XRE-family HTH domain